MAGTFGNMSSGQQVSGTETEPVFATSRPRSPSAIGIHRRRWNPPPKNLFASDTSRNTLTSMNSEQLKAARNAVRKMKPVPPEDMSVDRPRQKSRHTTSDQSSTENSYSPKRHSVVTTVQFESIARGSTKRLSQVTWSKIQQSKDDAAAAELNSPTSERKKKAVPIEEEIEAAAYVRRDIVRSAQVATSLTKQDVEAEDVRPLIEIAYWSPFLEVRRDAAAALASLSRNPANLEMLSQAGTLGALISMLGTSTNTSGPSIARDCAQALANLAKLNSVKLKLLQAPDGLECVFSLLHSSDVKLRPIGFELLYNLVTVEELREAVAKKEGFAYLLESCKSKYARIRLLAASTLHRLAESRENRFLFYHSTHFDSLAVLLHDPFLQQEIHFRRELLGFIHLLVSEEDNGRKFVEFNLIPTLLFMLDSPKTSPAIYLLIVSIIECLALNRRNHPALVVANALPRIVHLCFSSHGGLKSNNTDATTQRGTLKTSRPSTAGVRAGARTVATLSVPKPVGSESTHSVTVPYDISAIIRSAFAFFCEMAKNSANREHVIRSKLVDFIAALNLYASSDKRIRRSVITLLTFLICKERERDRRASTSVLVEESTPHSRPNSPSLQQSRGKQTLSPPLLVNEVEYKHYIELLARGVVKCLFGILNGNDFSMKVDAIAAIAQLTEDEDSRITMCKSPLLQSLKEFAFHPLIQTRTNVARIIANFAERPENILKLVDEGMLGILVKYVCPLSRNNDLLVEATRAIAAMSMIHVTRNKLVECGVLGTLIQFSKSPSTTAKVQTLALVAIRNLRHDAAALRIQAIYRGWSVRAHYARSIVNRMRRARKRESIKQIKSISQLEQV